MAVQSAITQLELNVVIYRNRSRSDGNCGKGEGIVGEEFVKVYLVGKPVISHPFAVISYPKERMPV